MAVAAPGRGGREVPHDQGQAPRIQQTRVNVQVVPRGHDRGGGTSGDKDDYSAVGEGAAGKPRLVSWEDAMDEEQQARETDGDDG